MLEPALVVAVMILFPLMALSVVTHLGFGARQPEPAIGLVRAAVGGVGVGGQSSLEVTTPAGG
jgi:hypothetical protein